MQRMPASGLPEIRRCAKCHEAAAVCVRDWKHTTMGISTGSSTRDFCCQNCGYRFTLAAKVRMWAWGICTLLFCVACIPSVIFGSVVAYDAWQYQSNPIVPDAPPPALRFRSDEPTRRCAKCGGIARCGQVTRTSSNGLPTGTDYDYRCDGCGNKFQLASAGSHVFNVFGATFCFALGFGCMPAGLLLWLMGAGVLAISAFQILAQIRNPLVSESVDQA